MSKSYSLDKRLKILSPCEESWEIMEGNDKVRFCSRCQKDVHNISSMTKEEAIELAFKSEGRLCVRYYKKSSGAIKFVPPVLESENKLEKSPLMRFAAGLFFAAALTSQSPVMAQTTPLEANLALAALQESIQQLTPQNAILLDETPSIKGVVNDQSGAVIAGTTLNLISKSTGAKYFTYSNENGEYLFGPLPKDNYTLMIAADAFQKAEIDISLANSSLVANITLAVESESELISMGGIAALSPGEEMIGYYEERDVIRKSEEEKPKIDDEITSLFSFVARNEIKEVKAILKNGVQLNLIDEEGETLLSYALGNEKMLKLLLKAGAEINLTNRFSTTALMYTSVRENTKIANILISYGANLNAIDTNGRSALIFAVADNNLEMVKLLLTAGANPNIRDNEGKTALGYASKYKFKQVKNLLKSIGAQK